MARFITRRQRRIIILWVSALVLVVVLGAGTAIWVVTHPAAPPRTDFNQANWERLCLSYHTWFGDFVDRFDDADRKKFSADPYPVEVARLLSSARDLDKYQPRKIANKPASAKDLALSPSDDARNGYGPNYTKAGVELIDKVTAALTPEAWPLLTRLDATRKIYEQRGWRKPAAGIAAIIAAARPPALPDLPADRDARSKALQQLPTVDIFAAIDNTIQAAQAVEKIDAGWTRIQDQLKRLPGGPAADVPLLKALPQFAEQFPRSEPSAKPSPDDVRDLAASFEQIQRVLAGLTADLAGQDIAYDQLARDPAAQLPADGKLTPDSFSGLPALARGYARLKDDPRAAIDWNKRLDDLQKQFIDVIRSTNAQDANLPALIQGRATLQQQVTDWAALAPIEKNRQAIETRAATARDDLAKLTASAEAWVAPYIIDPPAYIARQRDLLTSSPLAKATPVVYAAWKTVHANLLAKVEAAPAELRKYQTYKAFDDKFNALQTIYTDLDRKIPAAVPGLTDHTGSDWRHAIAERVAGTYREDALKDLMTNAALKWADDLPQVNDPAYVAYQRERLAAYEKVRTDAVALTADFSAISDQLDHLRLQPGEAQAGAASWRDLAGKWHDGKSPLLADAAVAAAVKPIADRAAALLAVDKVTDYKTLVADTASPAPEVALTAWRKLGSAPIAQDLPVLDDEDKAQAGLTTLLTGLAHAAPPRLDAAQLQALTNELKAQRPLRWRRFVEVASAPGPVQTALDRRAAFDVTLSPDSDAALIYNQALYDLRKQFDKGLKEAEFKPAVQSFIDAVNRMPAAVSKSPPVQDLLGRLTRLLSQPPDDAASSSSAGPQLAGWEADKSRPEVRLFYFPNKDACLKKAPNSHILEFVKLQYPSGQGQKTIFLCSSEMSVGVFADIANASGKIADLDNAGKPEKQRHWFKPDDGPSWWEGPRVWSFVNHRLAVNAQWLSRVGIGGTQPPPTSGIDPPSADMPIQYLSPWSAMYVARLLGCRLPTSDEWKAAYDKFEAANAAAPRDAWNLRGAAWKLQFDFAKQAAATGMQFPDAGIFLTEDLSLGVGGRITAADAKPCTGDDLAKLAPPRISPGPDPYKGSVLWFRKVGNQPGATVMHDLVGNVAEYVFDGTPDKPANAIIKDAAAAPQAIEDALAGARKSLFVIGGSSLSPAQLRFDGRQSLDPEYPQAAFGFSDVGFRLAYTAPIDSPLDIVATLLKDPPYLPGSRARQ